jgi:Calcineurin-like phosphoesterase
MKKQTLLKVVLLLFILVACQKEYQSGHVYNSEEQTKSSYDQNSSGHIKIAVVSDIHFMDPSLLQNNAASGTAFNEIFASAPYYVMLEHSSSILSKVVSELLFENPDIVLVPGDLTKDGENISHQAVAGFLNQLRTNGIKVYVIPGNNDINNPTSFGYNGNSFYPVPNINPSQFTSIYWNFGFGNAIATDPNSLSYVAEPFPGLRILAIDAARYSPIYHRSGTIKPQTMLWIKQQMALANASNTTVLGMMHHNVIEHFSGQPQLSPNSVIEDISRGPSDNLNWIPRADSFIAWGLKVMFTGHSHINDISTRVTDGKTLYDIATGSLITPPSPYRIIVLKNNELEISTNHVRSIEVSLPNNQSFPDYSNQRLTLSFDNYFNILLKTGPFSLTEPALGYAVPLARNAYMGHIAGDENISPLEQAKIDSLSSITPVPPTFTIWAINTLWTDIGVKDGKWHIKLSDP